MGRISASSGQGRRLFLTGRLVKFNPHAKRSSGLISWPRMMAWERDQLHWISHETQLEMQNNDSGWTVEAFKLVELKDSCGNWSIISKSLVKDLLGVY